MKRRSVRPIRCWNPRVTYRCGSNKQVPQQIRVWNLFLIAWAFLNFSFRYCCSWPWSLPECHINPLTFSTSQESCIWRWEKEQGQFNTLCIFCEYPRFSAIASDRRMPNLNRIGVSFIEIQEHSAALRYKNKKVLKIDLKKNPQDK